MSLSAPLRHPTLDERLAAASPDPQDVPAVPADLLADLIPTTPIHRPEVPDDAATEVRIMAGQLDDAIAGVMGAREAARQATSDAAGMTVSELIVGEADRVVGAVVAALEAEERVRGQIAAFCPIAKEAARAALQAVMPTEAEAREKIAAKLAKLGYHGDRNRYRDPGYMLHWPAAIAAHPSVHAAKDRIAAAKALRDGCDDMASRNAAALLNVRRALLAARRRAVTF